jgi:predicted nucleotidyltransferase component of viral defense system
VIDPQLHEGDSFARLLARMNREAQNAGVPARRIHLVVAIDRLLARLLVSAPADSWVVKGGFANQLRRPDDARFTQDIDLRIAGTIDTAPMLVADAFGTDLDDLFSYGSPAPPATLEGPPGGGLRFLALAHVAGSELVRFKIDISTSDAVVGPLESHLSDPVLVAVGYPRSSFPVYPVAQSIAEKVHALTLPRDRENSRARDLVDLVWFAERFSVSSSELIDAAVATFAVRADHPWPPSLSVPPASWVKPYARLRTEVGLVPETPDGAIAAVAVFLAPVIAGIRGLRWDPTAVAWS